MKVLAWQSWRLARNLKKAKRVILTVYTRSLRRALSDGSRGRFIHLKDLICRNILDRLTNATRPVNLDRPSNCLLSQTEMHPFVAGRKIAAGCLHCCHLRALRG